VYMIVNPGSEAECAKKMLPSEINLIEIPHDDAWARDNCPEFALDQSGKLVAIDWKFNAWGWKYPTWKLDDAVPKALCDLWNIERIEAPLFLEGGSVHVNGEGALLATEECLLNPNRNPDRSKLEIKACLLDYFGANKMVWLPFGLEGDETDGHVDNVACFASPNHVLLHSGKGTRMEACAKVLTDAGFEISTFPEPEGVTIPAASYINFSFVNGGIVMPALGSKKDSEAFEKMKALFPDREVVQVDSIEVLRGGGNIHCITRQVPRGAR
ncbi:MAG: agmatine deiminase family protein, partial [Clostridiales bacterium]|nr:agmatine deiminase family protein [Clostridiales bacterium]